MKCDVCGADIAPGENKSPLRGFSTCAICISKELDKVHEKPLNKPDEFAFD